MAYDKESTSFDRFALGAFAFCVHDVIKTIDAQIVVIKLNFFI